jgi:hypothetical protein
MTRRSLPVYALLSTLVLAGCSDVTTIPEAQSPLSVVRKSSALVGSFNLPITFPTDIASDGGAFLYLSTGDGFRVTHKINRLLAMDVGTIPTGGNPRGLAFDGLNLLVSDYSNVIDQRTVTGALVASHAIPFHGMGVATDGDTIWVGDQDSNQWQLTNHAGFLYTTYSTGPVRSEGMVFDASSHTIWVITPFNDKIYEMSTVGNVIRYCDSPYDPGSFGLGGIAMVSDTFYIAEPQGGDPYAGTTILIIPKADLVCYPALVQNVSILIKPSNINLNGNGKVHVAILTDKSFNASLVDPTSVRFGHSGNEAIPLSWQMQDADGDGDIDLVLKFNIQDTGIVCGDVVAYATGKTSSNQKFIGSNAIQVKGCKP